MKKSTSNETIKREEELRVFLEFAERSGLRIDRSSVRNGCDKLNEPDILCADNAGVPVGFELSRLTDPTLARMINRPIDSECQRLGGHSVRSLVAKLKKSYSVARVELLLYRENIGTPDNILIPQVKIYCRNPSSYVRIWFMSNRTIEIMYERS